ncbi:hypothetical protein [Cronobacter dublinensis]|uniref:hypothetical protein n=1 Tax=Cronobacter dublinensis TaxID=413497 RepID=UPI003AEDAD23
MIDGIFCGLRFLFRAFTGLRDRAKKGKNEAKQERFFHSPIHAHHTFVMPPLKGVFIHALFPKNITLPLTGFTKKPFIFCLLASLPTFQERLKGAKAVRPVLRLSFAADARHPWLCVVSIHSLI